MNKLASLSTALLAALALCLGVAPSARADAFIRGSYEVRETDVRIVLTADGPVHTPRIRTDEGFVRAWFPGTDDMTDVEVLGDGGAVRFARARPGASDTGVVVVRIGDMRRLPSSAVHAELSGNVASIVIQRSALPALRVAAPAAPAAPVAEAAPAAVTAAASAELADEALEPALEEPAEEPAAEEAALAPLTTSGRRAAEEGAATEPAEPTTLGLPASSGPSAITIAIVLALLLAGLFLLRRFAMNGNKDERSTIRVIASHRLGPRQQLVLVRALGQDHLLAVDSAKTERLSSVPTPVDADPETSPDMQRGLSLVLGGRKSQAPASEADRFSAALMAAAEGTQDSVRTGARSTASPNATSDAVAGLLRLRSKVAAR